MNYSEHYPTFIDHPDDKTKRALVKTPWLHHKQLLAWGLEGLTPAPAAPAGAEAAPPDFDPEYPKWIENQNTHQRLQVPSAAAERAQLDAWGLTDAKILERIKTAIAGEDAGPVYSLSWSPEWKGVQAVPAQCRTSRGGKQCLLEDGHAGNHQYRPQV